MSSYKTTEQLFHGHGNYIETSKLPQTTNHKSYQQPQPTTSTAAQNGYLQYSKPTTCDMAMDTM